MSSTTFKSFVPGALTEGRDLFPEVDVLKIDPDRADVYDVIQALMPTFVRIAYTHLMDDKVKYDRSHSKDDEDYTPFDFSEDALEERLDDLIKSICDKLDDQTTSNKKTYVNDVKKEFKEKLS